MDELSTGHFNMPYDMVREGKESVISIMNFQVLSNPPLQTFFSRSSVALLTSFHSVAVNIAH